MRLSGSPNPFAGATTIAYRLARSARAELAIYNAQGKQVSALKSEWLPRGPGTVRWDGMDSKGRRVSPGVYFCTMRLGDERVVAKLIAVR
jgi:flagellar hook assembly protein FlgD